MWEEQRHPSDHEEHGLRLHEASEEAAYDGTQQMKANTSDSHEADRVALKTAFEGKLGNSQDRHFGQKKLTKALVFLVGSASEGIEDDHCTLPPLWDQQDHYQLEPVQWEHVSPMRSQGLSSNSEEEKGFLVAMKSLWDLRESQRKEEEAL